MVEQTDANRRTIRTEIRKIRAEIQEERDFIEFGATTDLDYQMAQARLAGLREERERLEELLDEARESEIDVVR